MGRSVTPRRAAMKNKRSWFAFPYVIWMALFVVIPILIMAVYAFTVTDPVTNAS